MCRDYLKEQRTTTAATTATSATQLLPLQLLLLLPSGSCYCFCYDYCYSPVLFSAIARRQSHHLDASTLGILADKRWPGVPVCLSSSGVPCARPGSLLYRWPPERSAASIKFSGVPAAHLYHSLVSVLFLLFDAPFSEFGVPCLVTL